MECLKGVAEHLDSQQIAHRLGISPHTVDSHIAAAIKALGAHSRRDAVKRAAAMTSQPLTGQFLPLDHHPFISSVSGSRMAVREEPSSFEAATPATEQDTTETQDGKVEQHPLRMIALITAIAAALVVLILAMDPLIQSAARLANAIDPSRKSD